MRHAILVFCFAWSLFPSIAFAQSQATTGTIQGYVKDESGGVLPGAEVTVRHVETGQTRELVTDSTGYYRALSLPSGAGEGDRYGAIREIGPSVFHWITSLEFGEPFLRAAINPRGGILFAQAFEC